MEILEAFALTGSLRAAAELAGCDHKTVGHWVAARHAAGDGLAGAVRPRPVVDRFAAKIEELGERSHGKIRADKAHETLVAMGYMGSERTTRRAVADAKRRWRQGHGRRHRPWIAVGRTDGRTCGEPMAVDRRPVAIPLARPVASSRRKRSSATVPHLAICRGPLASALGHPLCRARAFGTRRSCGPARDSL
jgi:hypothetical protein